MIKQIIIILQNNKTLKDISINSQKDTKVK